QDRWLTALVYLLSPLFPAILFFIIDINDYPFLKSQIYQALLFGILLTVTLPLIVIATLGLGAFIWLILPFWAIKAYGGENIIIPIISHFVEEQGWGK
ncbi:MAG: hypothetical protein LWX83_15960, partial [Anaerolineae bacterium]|nr:hypothetical protein [Anaerolineae bacterium]